MSFPKYERYEALDSLRGLAALSVVISHFLAVLPSVYDQDDKLWLLKHTPLHIFWAGHEPVIFFFVLSGFVLSLQFFRKRVEYKSFIIKRVCRIYIPYYVCIFFAILMSQIFYKGSKESLSSWFNQTWAFKPSFGLIINHLFLIPSFKNYVYAPVLWSLVQEMRISIIFPFIIILVSKFNWKINIGLASLTTFVSIVLIYVLHRILNCRSDYPLTIHYISMFIFGALLAKNREYLIGRYQSISKIRKLIILLLGCGLYSFTWLLSGITDFHLHLIEDWLISAGISIFIISALGSGKLSKLLTLGPVLFLGQISYSLYLLHTIVLLTLIHLLYSRVHIWTIWFWGLLLSFFLAWLSYKYIEVPSINVGRHFINKRQ